MQENNNLINNQVDDFCNSNNQKNYILQDPIEFKQNRNKPSYDNITKDGIVEKNNVTVENNILNNNIKPTDNYESKKGLIPLILSIINIFSVPGIIYGVGGYSFLLVLFGVINIYFYIAIFLLYIVFSLLFFFISYINFFRRSKTKKRKCILIIVGIIILFFIYKCSIPFIHVFFSSSY